VEEEEEGWIWVIVGYVDVMISLRMLSRQRGLARLVSIHTPEEGVVSWTVDNVIDPLCSYTYTYISSYSTPFLTIYIS
jgi:hypothetical protein